MGKTPTKKTTSSSEAAKTSKNATKAVEAKRNPGQEALDAKLAAEADAKRVAMELEAEQQSRWCGKVWNATLPEMPKAMKKAEAAGLTPLILDNTPQKAVDTFYSYQGAQVIEGKKLVMQGRTPDGLAQVMQECKALMLRAMARGYTLYLRMTNCAADVKDSYQNPNTLPLEVWDRALVNRVLGENLLDMEDSPLRAVVTEDDCYEYDMGRGMFFVHKDFRVVICSHFEVEDYEEFLTRALPMERLQAIRIQDLP